MMDPVKIFDWGMFWTTVGAAIAIVGFIYQFFRNMRSDFAERFKDSDRKFVTLENRLFYLATGKTVKEILLEEKRSEEENKE